MSQLWIALFVLLSMVAVALNTTPIAIMGGIESGRVAAGAG